MKIDSKNTTVRRTRFLLQFLFVLSLVVSATSRHAYALQADAAHAQQQPAASQRPTNPEQQLTSASREAAHPGEQEDENAAFKYSSSVKFFSKMFGGDVVKGYWAFTILNFVVIAALILWMWKSVWPKVVVSRNQRISRALEEARRASEDAQRRLGDIEARLSRLDTDIASMRSQAEREGAAEEERIRMASAEEKRRILEAADQEIASVTANARRELKAFTAEMAVNLAQSRIAAQIDDNSDEQLVREFATRLGKEGHA